MKGFQRLYLLSESARQAVWRACDLIASNHMVVSEHSRVPRYCDLYVNEGC